MKKLSSILLSALAIIISSNCTSTKISKPSTNQQSMTSIYEIAINQAKDGNVQHFLNTRSEFVKVLGKESTALNEGKWNPFFTVDPSMKLDEILIGMTHWNSMQGFGETAMRLLPQEVSTNYFATFNPLSYGLLETLDGQTFDMETIKKQGNVIEFSIRKGITNDAFGEKRETFFKSLENYDGYKFAREFKFYTLDAQGIPSLSENTQAVIIVWDNVEQFQAAATPIFNSKEYAAFSNLIEVQSYFATFAAQ